MDKQEIEQVIFAAGKAHFVPKTEAEKRDFFDVNVGGLKNFLQGLDGIVVKQFILISSVAVYGCEQGDNIRENQVLNASDPYGKSKIEAEALAQDWCYKNATPLIIFRLPLIAGKNPLGNLEAVIQGLQKNRYFRIGRGANRKSVVLAEDVANFCCHLPAGSKGIFHLTDGYDPTFSEIDGHIAQQLKIKHIPRMPFFMVKCMALVGDLLGSKFPINSNRLRKMISTLTFSSQKAMDELNWRPRKSIEIDYLY